MNEICGKITDSELMIMDVLWDAKAPLSMAELRSSLTASGWESSTIKTLVQRLCAKGAVEQIKRKVYYYAPAVTRGDMAGHAVHSLIDKLYNGSARALVTALVHTELSPADIAELRLLLEDEHG